MYVHQIETKYNINDWVTDQDGKEGVIVAIDVRHQRNMLCKVTSFYTYRVSFKGKEIDIRSLEEDELKPASI